MTFHSLVRVPLLVACVLLAISGGSINLAKAESQHLKSLGVVDTRTELDKRLLNAIAEKDTNAVTEALAQGANPNCVFMAPTVSLFIHPVEKAAMSGDLDILLKVLDAGGDPRKFSYLSVFHVNQVPTELFEVLLTRSQFSKDYLNRLIVTLSDLPDHMAVVLKVKEAMYPAEPISSKQGPYKDD